jgi:hypothetical protein
LPEIGPSTERGGGILLCRSEGGGCASRVIFRVFGKMAQTYRHPLYFRTVPVNQFGNHMGLQVLDGQLSAKVGLKTVELIEGDILFIPANTSFQYWSEVGFTRFMHFSTGTGGLGSDLISKGKNWTSPMWPTYAS